MSFHFNFQILLISKQVFNLLDKVLCSTFVTEFGFSNLSLGVDKPPADDAGSYSSAESLIPSAVQSLISVGCDP